MKKGLITLAVILALVMSMAIMAPAFAAEANDFDCLIVSPKAKDVGVSWGGQGTSTGAVFTLAGTKDYIKVADDGSVLVEGKGEAGEYIYIYPTGLNGSYNNATSETYPYICASVKITGADDDLYFVYGDGDANDTPVGELTEYTKVIDELPAGVGLKYEMVAGALSSQASRRIIKVVDYSSGATLQGVNIYIEYVGFFKTKADAEAFDYEAWLEDNKASLKEEWGGEAPETSEPETSEPETSEPETSTPETSEPETSTPETSAPETSAPETSEPETSAPETSEPETSKPQTSTPDKTDDDEKGGNALTYILIAAAVVVVVVVVVVVAKKGKK